MANGFQLFYGAGVRAKSSDLFSECNKRYASDKADTFVIVVPSHRYALDISRRMSDAAPQQWRRPPVYSIASFIWMLLPKDDAMGTVISLREMSVIINDIVLSEPKSFNSLIVRQSEETFPGLVADAVDAIIEVKKEFGKDPHIKGKADNVAQNVFWKVFERYQKYIKEHEFADEGDVYCLAASSNALDILCEQFPNLDMIIFDGMDVFPQTLIDMMKNISGKIRDTIVLVEYEEERPLLFGYMEETFERLSKSSASIHKVEARGESFKDRVLQNFYRDTEAASQLSNDGAFIKSFILPNRTKEVRFIARFIKDRVLSGEAQLQDFCVCFPSIKKYSSLVSEIFDEYGIDFNLSPGMTLAQIPSIRALELWLRLIESNFERANFLRVLINPYLNLPLIAPEKERPRSDSIYNCIRELRGGEGMAMWIESLEQKIKAAQIAKENLNKGFGFSEEEREKRSFDELEIEIREYSKILAVFRELKSLEDDFAGEKTFGEFAEGLNKSLKRMEFQKHILYPKKDIPEQLRKRDVKALNQFNRIHEDLNHLHQLLGDKPIAFTRFANEVREALAETSFHAEEPMREVVQILGRLEPRLFSFPYFILGGFLEGELPHSSRITPFLDFDERKKIGMAQKSDTMISDRYLFYHYLRQTKECMIITRPAFDNETQLLPSPILRELERAAALETIAPAKSAAIYSEQEWQRAKGDPQKEEADINVRITPDEKLEKRSLFSVSQLEKYAQCAFKYFAENVLHLSEPPSDSPDEDLSNLERGNILHRVLFLFYQEWTRKNKAPFTDDKSAEEAAQRLVEIAEEHLNALPYNDLFWDAKKEEIIRILKDFTQKEKEFFEKQGQYIPKYFEVAFGNIELKEEAVDPISTKEPYTIKERSGDIKLRGKIDRIEICGDSFAVVDYKFGSNVKQMSDVEKGTSLQLAIYLLAAKEILEKHLKREMKKAAGLFYKINDKEIKRDSQIISKENCTPLLGSGRRPTCCETQEELEDLLKATKENIKKYVSGIRKGDFPVGSDSDKLCGYCAFSAACRI